MKSFIFSLVVLSFIALSSASPVVVVSGEAECEFCKFAVNEIESKLSTNSSSLLRLLKETCSLPILSVHERGVCNSFVQKYGSEIIEVIEQIAKYELNSDKVCELVHACAAPSTVNSCDMCVSAVSAVETELKNNPHLLDILVQDVDQLCRKLGSTVVDDMCEAVAKKYIPVLVHDIEAVDPRELCTDIKMC